MNWGNKVVLSFIAFVIIIVTMVVVSMKQDIFLVSEDYYDKEVKYQSQIDKMKLASSERATVTISKDSDKVQFDFSDVPEKGEILFFRPSDATKDFKVEVMKEKRQSLSKDNLGKGYWKMKISWSANGNDYYTEKSIVI
ncbi:FixH family protein [Reichenbachiella sp. MALMAid0571]|uniref:FixH family protein n=1 Tax=Reichenbachiella sp. MALMAid0571 TaxID=3143939 RepID=UPI0032E01DCC